MNDAAVPARIPRQELSRCLSGGETLCPKGESEMRREQVRHHGMGNVPLGSWQRMKTA